MIHVNVHAHIHELEVGDPKFDHACLEVSKLEVLSRAGVTDMMILRGQVNCAKCETCDVEHPVPFGPGKEYVDAVLDAQGIKAVNDGVADLFSHRASLASTIRARMSFVGLRSCEVQFILNDRLKSTVDDVLGNVTARKEDYALVFSFIVLWEKLISSAHARMYRDWPNRHD